MLTKEQIAKRITQEVKDNYFVNLGIGIPTMIRKLLTRSKIAA
jgi:3-oxoacid CoA-transferase subunit B